MKKILKIERQYDDGSSDFIDGDDLNLFLNNTNDIQEKIKWTETMPLDHITIPSVFGENAFFEKNSEGIIYPPIVENLEGLFVNEAMDMLDEYNFKLRIQKRDGIPLFGTTDLDHNRINVETKDGIIIKVLGFG